MLPTSFYKRKQGSIYFSHYFCVRLQIHTQCSNFMELLVYKASAGSGKTFTLAVEYIKHLIINPRAYRQILAVTFTNKATAEMKERILTQLYGIWKGAPSSEAYLERIKNYKLKIKVSGPL